jgi:hypothetical protein
MVKTGKWAGSGSCHGPIGSLFSQIIAISNKFDTQGME